MTNEQWEKCLKHPDFNVHYHIPSQTVVYADDSHYYVVKRLLFALLPLELQSEEVWLKLGDLLNEDHTT